jgi:DNA recombination-dependent growth factor C
MNQKKKKKGRKKERTKEKVVCINRQTLPRAFLTRQEN